jgi:uncharacterized Fe-S cluster-containing radical SAM superfamily protein
MPVDTEGLARKYRAATIDLAGRRLMLTNFRGTQQEQDLTEPPNCDGFGRVRHFRRATSKGWPLNPLPIDPAHARLGLPHADEVRAQVFQNAACNWRCWYCFVPYSSLDANPAHSAWLTPEELVSLYLKQEDRPAIIDLSGGQPELTPEWVPWMIEALDHENLRGSVYLWSDDNLSCDYFWRYLSSAQQELVSTYRFYSRVACFKGFDEESFKFNTRAEGEWFSKQFELMTRLVASGMDVYAYVTFTAPREGGIRDAIRRFVDRLQEIDELFPLRTVPLEIQEFSPVVGRLTPLHQAAFRHQWVAVEVWQDELSRRFSPATRSLAINEVALRSAVLPRNDRYEP